MKPLVTIILPCYNEESNLSRGVLQNIADYLRNLNYEWEVLISDDGSSDNSLSLVRDFTSSHPRFRVLANPHAGKPYALRSAINQAKGKYLLFTDMDQSTPISELSKLIPFTKQGYQVVIGSRGSRRKDSSLFRQIASISFLLARRLIILPEIKDTQCGFKLMETTLAKQVFSEMRLFGRNNDATGWKVTAYDVEMLYLAKKHGQKIKEVRVIWKNEDTSINKSRNFIKESLEMFFEVLRVRVNDFFGKYSQ